MNIASPLWSRYGLGRRGSEKVIEEAPENTG